MSLGHLNKLSPLRPSEKLPVLFLGHGSPMNAIEENEFVKGWREKAKVLPYPSAILCISAHWETKATHITAMEHPKTIHDFYGFPQQLFAVEYPAPGSPELAATTQEVIAPNEMILNYDWGLDHGSWSVIKHFYPQADVPVVQMSLNTNLSPAEHYAIAKQLSSLREKGVLIIGSGNMVHNLRIMDWSKPHSGYDWADEANEKLKLLIQDRNHQSLIQYQTIGKELQLSIPTPEHYLPLLYILALQEKAESVNIFNDKTIMGSISMTSLQIG